MWYVFIITGSSLVGLVIIIINYDPYVAGQLIKLLFFSSLILVSVGLVMAIRLVIKKFIAKNKTKDWQDAT